MTTWTTPYYGVSHLEGQNKRYRVTIEDRGTFADLSLWFPGCGFSPIHQQHDSAEAARAAGEEWLRSVA